MSLRELIGIALEAENHDEDVERHLTAVIDLTNRLQGVDIRREDVRVERVRDAARGVTRIECTVACERVDGRLRVVREEE